MRAVTVYADGEAKEFEFGRGDGGGVFPSAVLDSGVPVLLMTTTIDNVIYGALGVRPTSYRNSELSFIPLYYPSPSS